MTTFWYPAGRRWIARTARVLDGMACSVGQEQLRWVGTVDGRAVGRVSRRLVVGWHLADQEGFFETTASFDVENWEGLYEGYAAMRIDLIHGRWRSVLAEMQERQKAEWVGARPFAMDVADRVTSWRPNGPSWMTGSGWKLHDVPSWYRLEMHGRDDDQVLLMLCKAWLNGHALSESCQTAIEVGRRTDLAPEVHCLTERAMTDFVGVMHALEQRRGRWLRRNGRHETTVFMSGGPPNSWQTGV